MSVNDVGILEDIKQAIGISPDEDAFDNILTMHTNAVLGIVYQLGVGSKVFQLANNETWTDFFENVEIENTELFNSVKSYIVLKVRMLFDPPSGAAQTAAESMISELEWRLNVFAEGALNG